MNKYITTIKETKRKIQLFINKIGSYTRNKKITNKNVTIISNNCFAGITYEYLNMPFMSPTIGLYFFAPEYIKFIKNLKHYATLPLAQIDAKESKYYNELKKLNQDKKIIGKIDDVEIVFLHYKSFKEAKEKWERRCKRINYDNIIYKFNDQNLCTEKELNDFYIFKAKNKICFTAKDYRKYGFIWMKKYRYNKYVKEDSYYYHRYLNIIDIINGTKETTKNIKILHVLLSNRYSGAENVACTIIDGLKNKYEIAYCCPKGPIEKVLRKKNIKYIPIKKVSILELKKVFDEYSPDIIHAHDYKTSFKCSLIKGRRKLITHLHNNSPWLKRPSLKSFALLFTAYRSRLILTVSDSIKDEYIFSRNISKKITQIGNPIFRDEILKKITKKTQIKKYDICCVARITESKNPIKFANVIHEIKKEIPNIKAIWVGDSNRCDIKTKNNFIRYIEESNLHDNISLLGYKENPYEYMNQSKILLLTSDWEGFGLVAYEALTLGIPCVVSKVGGLPSIVTNKCGKLCNNINEYASAIKSLLKDRVQYEQYSKAAIERSKEIENYNDYMARIERIYQTV